MEELDEIFGEINEEDQTLLAAGIGGVNEEDEDEALRLQEQLSRQRQQRERTPPAQDDTDDLNRFWEALQSPHRRRRFSEELDEILGEIEEDQDDTDDLNRRWEALQRPHRRRRLSSPPQNGSLLTPPQSDSHCININPFFG